jgi:hypothetical protein
MPANNSFLDQIKKYKIYPVTSLRRLPRKYKKLLLTKNVILAREVLDHKIFLTNLGMSLQDLNILLDEISMLTGRTSWK